MFRYLAAGLLLTLIAALPAVAQDSDKSDKPFDVRSSVGDLHVGKDADAKKAGLPLYPGARAAHEKDNDPLNFGVITESFGLKLVIAKYESDDATDKVLAFYKDKMKKYGKVLECHDKNDHNGFQSDSNDDDNRPLTCEGDNNGPVTELKVGTEGNAHIVAIESPANAKGTTFTIIYMHKRGKSGDV